MILKMCWFMTCCWDPGSLVWDIDVTCKQLISRAVARIFNPLQHFFEVKGKEHGVAD